MEGESYLTLENTIVNGGVDGEYDYSTTKEYINYSPAILVTGNNNFLTIKWDSIVNGDIKATQGDTGHSQADMVMDLYSHILDEDRRVNAQRFEDSFYKQNMENYVEVPQASKKVDIDQVLEKIKQDSELLQLLIATLGGD